MEDRRRAVALGLVLVAGILGARPATASPAAFFQLAPLVADEVSARGVRAAPASGVTPVTASPARRPAPLIPLYGAFGALQFADARSSYQATRLGLVEVNPLMSGVAGSPARLAAVKIATTACVIAGSELLWRNHPRGAVVTMVLLNVVYGAVLANNLRQTH